MRFFKRLRLIRTTSTPWPFRLTAKRWRRDQRTAQSNYGTQPQAWPWRLSKDMQNAITALAFSRDSKLLASAAYDDETVLLWDTATGTQLQSLGGHSGGVCAVAFSPKDTSFATASSDAVWLWNPITGQPLRLFKFDYSGAFHGIAFSVDGELLAASESVDTPVVVWRLVGGVMQPAPLDSPGGRAYDVAFSLDGTRLPAACDKGMVVLWDIATSSVLRTLGPIADECGFGLAFSADSSLLAAVSSDKILLCDAISGIVLLTIRGRSFGVKYAAFSPDRKQLAVASEGCIRLWDLTSAGAPQSLDDHSREISIVRFSPDGRILESASVDGAVLRWDMATVTVRQEPCGHITLPNIPFSSGGELLVSILDEKIEGWNTAEGTLLRILEDHEDHFKNIGAVASSPDNKQLATASQDQTLKLWDVSTGKVLRTLHVEPHVALVVAKPSRQMGAGWRVG